jgi:transcriptional regulator with XRE-family HTH domain
MMNITQKKKEGIGEKLNFLFETFPVSKAKVAKKLGISRATLYRWLNNETKPSYNYLKKLAEIFKLPSVDYFFSDEKFTEVALNISQQALEDLPPEAVKEFNKYLEYLAFKYKSSKRGG